MKHFNLNALAVACMLAFAANTSAKDIYVASNGADTNDGTTAATAFATLAKAVSAATKGDVIKVSGMVATESGVTLEGTYEPNEAGGIDTITEFGTLTIEGTSSATDGFLLEDCADVCIIARAYELTVRNLKFDQAGAGAIDCDQCTVNLENCVFSECEGDNGGAYHGLNCTTTAKGCTFSECYANGNGGAFNAAGGNLNIYNSVFSENSAGSNGGALSVVDTGTTDVEFCTFNDNSCNSRGGALNIGGGNVNLKFIACAIVDNVSSDHAGAVMLSFNDGDVAQTYTFGSCTISTNKCSNAGGSIFNDGPASNEDSSLNLVNCTIMGNATDNNMGNSAGLWLFGANYKTNIINTILEGNWAAGNETWSDGWWRDSKVTIKNSFVGWIFQWDDYADNFTVSPNSSYQMMQSGSDMPACGLIPDVADNDDFADNDRVENCYPLVPGSDATKIGDASAARGKGVKVDQFGQEWTDDCKYVGAVKLLKGEALPEIDGIENVQIARTHETKIYNLAGQQVTANAKGIVICNGKKYLMK